MDAEVIKRNGSFADEYYALRVKVPGLELRDWPEYDTIILQAPAHLYPSLTTAEGFLNEGLCEQSRVIFEAIAEAIRNLDTKKLEAELLWTKREHLTN